MAHQLSSIVSIQAPLTKQRSNRQLKTYVRMMDAIKKTQTVVENPGDSGKEHANGLLLVGLFKLTKAIFFSLVGAGALKLIHKNIGSEVLRLVDWLHIDSEGRLASFLMDKADLIGHHQLRQGALFAFLYAGLCLIEGTGLVKRKVWAEYFTVSLTAAALPWEGYELVARFESYKVVLLLVNLAVLLYLLLVLKHKREKDAAAEADRSQPSASPESV